MKKECSVGGGMRASQREKRWGGRRDGPGGGGVCDRRREGRKGTATAMGAGGCSIGVKRSPEIGDGGGDRLIWTVSG